MRIDPFKNLGLKTVSVFIAVLLWLIVAGERPAERTLERVPVHVRNLGPGLVARALPPTVRVTVGGSEAALAPLDSGAVTAFVDVSELGVGAYELPIRLDPTTGFSMSATEPPVVQIMID
jgi:YbbR domain-containing protein